MPKSSIKGRISDPQASEDVQRLRGLLEHPHFSNFQREGFGIERLFKKHRLEAIGKTDVGYQRAAMLTLTRFGVLRLPSLELFDRLLKHEVGQWPDSNHGPRLLPRTNRV